VARDNENLAFCDNTRHKIQVIWNNCFRPIFSCCWRESVKPLQYFCNTLLLSYAIDQSKLLFWKKMFVSDNQTLVVRYMRSLYDPSLLPVFGYPSLS